MAERSVVVRLAANASQYMAAMEAAKRSTMGLAQDAERSLKSVGQSMQSVGRSMTMALTVPLAGVAVASTRMAQNFQNSFSRMVGLAEVPASAVERLQEAVKGLSSATGRAPAELAAGLYQAASSGMDAAAALEATELAAKASALGMGNAKDATGLIAAATNAYGKENITAAETMDMLTMAIREGRAEPDEMAHALGRVIPIAAAMGIGFDQVAGTVAYLSNIMGDTDITVTSLRDALVKLNNPTVQGRETLLAMGTSVEELRATIADGGILGAFDLLREKGFDQNTEAVQRLFADVQGQQAAFALLDDASGALAVTLGKTADAQGSFNEAFAVWDATDAASVSKAWGEIQVAMLEVGEVLLPIVADVLGAVGDLAGAFADLPGPVQGAIVALGGIVAVAGPLLIATGMMVNGIIAVKAAMIALGGLTLPAWLTAGLAAAGPFALAAGAVGVGTWASYQVVDALAGGGRPDRSEAERRQRDILAGERVAEGTATQSDIDRVHAQRRRREILLGTGDVGVGSSDPWGPENYLPPPTVERAVSMPAPPISTYDIAMQQYGRRQAVQQQTSTDTQFVADINRGIGIAAEQWGEYRQGVMDARNANDRFVHSINNTIDVAAEQYAEFQRNKQAVEEYARVSATLDWGEAAWTGARTAMSAYNTELFGAGAVTASMEGSMDSLSEALEKVGTVGVGGLNDLNLKTEEGRAAFGALQQVAAAWQPALEQAVVAADGNVADLSAAMGVMRADFIEMAVGAGIGRTEAEALATAIGLIPENATTLIELSGQEEAKIQIQLLSGMFADLSAETQAEMTMHIDNGDYLAALRVAQRAIGLIPDSKGTLLTAEDRASAALKRIRDAIYNIPTSRVIRISTDTSGVQTSFRVGNSRIIGQAEGGYWDRPQFGVWAEDGPEVILPLTKPDRMRALLSDPRVMSPLSAAMGGNGGSGGGAASVASLSPSFDVRVFVGNREITDIVRTEFKQRDDRQLAGARFG